MSGTPKDATPEPYTKQVYPEGKAKISHILSLAKHGFLIHRVWRGFIYVVIFAEYEMVRLATLQILWSNSFLKKNETSVPSELAKAG